MAEAVKSVLYVDYDSLHRSLKASGSAIADRLAQRAAAWVAAIESGRLVVPKGKALTRRRMQARRCYADPDLLAKGRLAFVACGFEVIDCPIAATQAAARCAKRSAMPLPLAFKLRWRLS